MSLSAPSPTPELYRDHEWQRLDPRMMLVHPLKEVIRFLPVLAGIFIAGSASGGGRWHLVGVSIPIALGLLRYLTTSFRIAEGRIELKRGLLNRHVLSTTLDRVRTVDLTSSPIHRVLGLTTVRVGTGTASTSDDERIDLDGLPVSRARELRAELLRVSPLPDPLAEPGTGPAPPAEREVLRFDLGWVRFAPLTSSGLVIAAAAIGAGSQVLNAVGFWDGFDPGDYTSGTRGLPLVALLPVAAIGLLAFVSVLAVTGYLLTNWDFRLSHAAAANGAGAWHLRRGLLTTRETSLDDDRVAGVTLGEPLGLRAVRGARLSAIVTGLGGGQQAGSMLAPSAPRDVVEAVAREVVGSAPVVTGPLTGHGPRARTRRYTRTLVPALVVAGGAVAVVALGGTRWWLVLVLALPLAVALAADRVRALGHVVADGYLVARSGSLNRRRSALGVDHVIGWNLRATWFQRRAGLTTLVATTAGGRQSVTVLDVPEAEAVAVAAAALPDLVAQFRAASPGERPGVSP